MTNTTKPSLDELENTLRDPSKITALLQDGRFGEFVKDYADARNSVNVDIGQQVKDETQRVLAEWLKDNGAASNQRINLTPETGVATLASQKSKIYNHKAPGASLDKDYPDSASFFQSIWHHSGSLQNAEELQALAAKNRKVANSYGSTVPADGGFLIPETLRSEILQVALESSIVRPRARVIPMETLRVPIPAIDSTSNASSVFGGVVCYWTEEGAALTESQASFGRVVLDAKKLTAYAEMPNELVSDASAFTGFFDQIYPQAMAFYEDDAFLNGNGVGMPLGVLKGSGIVNVTENTANVIKFADIVAMYSRMLPSSLGSAVWVASIDTFPQLAALEMTAGSPVTWFGGAGSGGLQGAPPMTILGRPVYFTEKTPALGTTGALSFIDFGYYLIGDRQVMQATSSPHYKFANDKTAFRIIERVDGRPWLQSAITPKNGSANTLSPYVTLLSA